MGGGSIMAFDPTTAKLVKEGFDPSTAKPITKQPKESDEPGFGEKAGALAYGGVTGLVGGLGELEKFGAYDVPEYLGIEKKRDDMGGGRETLFPTIKEVESGLGKVGIKKPGEEVSGYETGGQILGGFGTSLPSMLKGTVKGAIGLSSKVGEESARALEKLGFKLSPAQLRRVDPVGQKGAKGFTEHNQDLANKLATEGTGESSKVIYPPKDGELGFIGGRLKDLGEGFDDVYKGKTFNIGQSAVDAIRKISQEEASQIGNTGISAVKSAADDIIKNFDNLAKRPGAKPGTFGIDGEALQRLRNSLTASARSTNRTNAHEIYNLVDVIDGSIASNHKDVAAVLNELRPKYRNTIILEDLQRAGGIHNGDISLDRLGKMLQGKGGTERIRNPKDIDLLANHGKNASLKATWEQAGTSTTEDVQALQRGLGAKLGMIPRALKPEGRLSRKLQSVYSTPAESTVGEYLKGKKIPGAAATSYGTATRPLQGEEQ